MPRYIRYKRYKQQVNMLNCNDINNWTDTCNYRLGSYVDICSSNCNCGETEGTEPILQYRWADMNPNYNYYCEGNDRYYKQRKEVSYDNGLTWMYNIPDEYRKGALYEANSRFCTSEKVLFDYKIDTTKEPYCEGYTKMHTFVKSVSFDNGQTWEELVWMKPDGTEFKEYVDRVVEENSCFCGYRLTEYRKSDETICGSEIGKSDTNIYEVWYEWSYCPTDVSYDEKTGNIEYRNPQPSYDCGYIKYEWRLLQDSVCGSEAPQNAIELTDEEINNPNN